jgi:serine O-acetyltransferase
MRFGGNLSVPAAGENCRMRWLRGTRLFHHIRADIHRLTAGEPDIINKTAVVLFNLGLHAVLLFRFSHWLSVHHLTALAVIVAYWNSVFTGAQISVRAIIGKGFVIYHPKGMVIGPAMIGENCTLTQTNLIGQRRGGGDRPTIGDHFYAGAGAKILGKIRIGNHVHVGANAVVVESLPDGVTAIGVPAKIVSRRGECQQLNGA